jgi:hypothetical protein
LSLSCTSFFVLWFIGGQALADSSQIPASGNKYDGDWIRLHVDVFTFKKADGTDNVNYCAPAHSKFAVYRELSNDNLSVRFRKVEPFQSTQGCSVVDLHTQYIVKKSDIEQMSHARSGFTFGGLVVPFKVYMGHNTQLSASSTVAPYVGFSADWDLFGITVTPVVAAGISLVPVANAATGGTDTKSAFTSAIGFEFDSAKNSAFHAGLLLGKDFLNKNDRGNDPTINKIWVSLYVGYSQ